MDTTACTDTTKFIKQIHTLQSQLPAVLEDFKKYYVFFNKNPTDAEYQQMFQNIKSNLTTLQSNLFKLSNDVESCINTINTSYSKIDNSIQLEKEKNTKLKLALGIVEQNNNASTELIYDYKNMYEYGYLRNWSMIFSIFIVGFAISKMFKAPSPTTNAL